MKMSNSNTLCVSILMSHEFFKTINIGFQENFALKQELKIDMCYPIMHFGKNNEIDLKHKDNDVM